MNSDSPTKGKAYPVCDDCKRSGKWNCPHLNSDSVEAQLLMYENTILIANLIDGNATRLKAFKKCREQAKTALDRHYASKFLELALEVCKNQPITFNRLERAVKEHFNG